MDFKYFFSVSIKAVPVYGLMFFYETMHIYININSALSIALFDS